MSNIDTDIIDLLDLINITLSEDFVDKWRFKYSEGFIKKFQIKLLETFQNSKPLKIDTLYTFLHKKCYYSREQILDFFESIDIDLYRPIVSGKLTKT